MDKIIKTLITITISACLVGCAILNREVSDETNRKESAKTKAKQQSIYTAGSDNLALMYNPYSSSIHPQVFAKKNNLKDIDLYVIINDSELLYSKANTQNANIANVKLSYKIMESYEKPDLIDSSMKVITFNKSENPKTYTVKLKVKPVEQEKFIIQTIVTDMLRQQMSIHFTEIDKTDPYSEDNFLITSFEDKQPYPYRFVQTGHAYNINYLCSNEATILSNGDRPLEPQITLTPYASDPATEDTSRFFNIEESGLNFILRPNKKCLYASTTDSSLSTNLVLPCFGGDFPNINTPEEMIKPLAYLCTTEEYAKLSETLTKKHDVDEFWYQNSHNIKKAKEQLKIYYTRARSANIYFTDYREGVLTDRGMLYTVFGPPKALALTSTSEVWIYKDKQNGQTVKFTFRKQKSRLCGYKYVLRRSTEYKPYWDKAVSTWRSGNIYTF